MAPQLPAQPSRTTVSPLKWGGTILFGGDISHLYPNTIDILGQTRGSSRQDITNISARKARIFSDQLPAKRAIHKITNGVLAMPLLVSPPEEDKKKDSAWDRAHQIERALKSPNVEANNSYRKMSTSLLKDLLTIGAAAVERQPGKGDRPFWLWDVNVAMVHYNPEWDPTNQLGVPRYLFGDASHPDNLVRLSSEQLFLIQHEVSSHQRISPSPVKTAIYYIECWLGVGDYQNLSTSKATRNTILQMVDATEPELTAFREYWNFQIEGEGETPIINREIKSTSLNARNDQELYLDYEEKMLRLIALAFDLTARDMAIAEPDNRATAGVAADASFQDAILPYSLTMQDHWNEEVVGHYEPGFTCELSDTEPRGEEAEAQTAISLFKGGLSSRNESRAKVGLPLIDGETGTAFFDGKPAEETEAGKDPEGAEETKAGEDPKGDDEDSAGDLANKKPPSKKRKRIRT